MNLARYYFRHVIPTGWRTVWSAFLIWRDLMTGNYANYALLPRDDPFQECFGWFWATLGEDSVYSKDFLEYLEELVRQVESGEIEMIPFEDVEALLEDLKDGDV